MLNWLKIKNLALIAEADIEFGAGLNVITGESGAGKSILLGAIALLLGERADKGDIREGAASCEISAGVTLPPIAVDALSPVLDGLAIPFDQTSPEIQLRRIVSRAQTRNYVNDIPVTLLTLKQIGDLLVDIHAASSHQSLLSPTCQLSLLDRYAVLENEIGNYAGIRADLKSLRAERDSALAGLPTQTEAAHLQMIVDEITRIAPEPGEDESLHARHQLAAHAKNVLEHSSCSISLLNGGENSIADQLGTVYRSIRELQRIDPEKTAPLMQSCDHLSETIRDLAAAIERFSADVELDEQAFAELEARIGALERLKRRFGPGLDGVLAQLDEAQRRLAIHRNASQLSKEFEQRENELLAALRRHAQALSASRRRAAGEFVERVKERLSNLGFPVCDLKAEFDAVEPGASGADRIELLFSANPGEPLQPLRNIASSGEISRIMLALKAVLAEVDAVPVLIFDEVDVNIGGETAKKVGNELWELARHRQLLCISHLPQIAARGEHHYAVVKQTVGDRTISSIVALSGEARIDELGRMLGGGKAALDHARNLI